jgi:Zn-dependent membrane protease YugP
VGVAAHEAGHALQDKQAYGPLKLRMMLVPVTQFASMAVFGIILLSFILSMAKLAPIAVAIFAAIALFQVVTLPVEFDASKRAKAQLLRLGLISPREREGVSKVLNAAALTYVAAMVASLMELLHWVLIMRGNDRD